MLAAIRIFCLAYALLLVTIATPPAVAQEASVTTIPVREFVDENGVDLFIGQYRADSSEVHIGDAESGISYRRVISGGSYYDTLLGKITASSGTYTVTIDGKSEEFTSASPQGPFTPKEERGNSLVEWNADTYRYTTALGASYMFDRPTTLYEFGNATGMVIESVYYPYGKELEFFYDIATYLTQDPYGQTVFKRGRRLAYVKSNTGYRINFTYQSDTVMNLGETIAWSHVTKVVAYNELDPSCNPSPSQCLAAGGWPSLTISPTGTSPRTYTDSAGRTTTYTFGGRQGKLVGIRLPGSSTDDVTIGYVTGTPDKVQSVKIGDTTTTYTYADAGNERTVTVKRGTDDAEVYKFDIAKKQLTYHKDRLGRITLHEYDADARKTLTTHPYGNKTKWEYGVRGNIVKTTYIAKPGSNTPDLFTTSTYPATCTNVNMKSCNKPDTVTDIRGQVTNYEYEDYWGTLKSITAPAPVANGVRPQTRYSYTRLSNMGTFLQSGAYRLTGISTCQTQISCAGTADEVKTTITYGQNLLPVSIIKAAGNGTPTATITQTFDRVGNLLTVDGPLAGTADTTRFHYNAARELIGEVGPDPDGGGPLKYRATRSVLDPDSGLLTRIDAGTATGQSDAAWAAMAVLDSVTVTYDGYRRKAKETLVTNQITHRVVQYSYDGRGRLECRATRMNQAVFDNLPPSACTLGTPGSFGPDRITKYSYDAGDRVVSTISAYNTTAAATETTTYTIGNQVWTLTDADNNVTAHEYDGQNRLVKTYFPVPAKGAGAHSTTDFEQLIYGPNGDLTSRLVRRKAAESSLTITYGYDNLGRLALKNLPGAEPDVTYSYDNLGRLKEVSQSGHSLTFTYNALGHQTGQTGPHGTISHTYDAAGRRTSMIYPGSGLTINYDYLVTGEVTRIRENGATSGVGVLASYAYDDRGRRTSLTRGNGTVTSYTYDNAQDLSQLVQNLGGTSHDLTLGFGRNPAGQITSASRSNEAYAWREHYNVSRPYTANGLNQYTASGPIVPTYDGRGNLTQAGPTTYAYSSENLLTSASGGITLRYDPLMRLYETTAGGVTTRMAYDGTDLIAEYNSSSTLLRRYVHGPGTDEPIVWYEGAGTTDRRWLHADERGSIIAVTNSAGTAIATNSYDEYGIPGSLNMGRFQYTGQTWLPELGFYNYKARLYSATLGRFLQTDPVGYDDGLNLYAYAGNDPINNYDPRGTNTIIVTAPQLSGPSWHDLMRQLDYLRWQSMNRPQPQVIAVGRGSGQGIQQPQNQEIRSKSQVCSALSEADFDVKKAWRIANTARKTTTNGKTNWNNPLLRESENWLTAAADYFTLPFARTAQVYVHQYRKLLPFSKSTPFSREALEAGLNGLSHINDSPEQLKDWCNEN